MSLQDKEEYAHLTKQEKISLADDLYKYGKSRIEEGSNLQACKPCLASVLVGAYSILVAETLKDDNPDNKMGLAVISEQFSDLLHQISQELSIEVLLSQIGRPELISRMYVQAPMQ
jgi:hypothetical protein